MNLLNEIVSKITTIALHILSRKQYENHIIQFPFKFSLMDKISCKRYIRSYIINILTFTLLLVILSSLKRKKCFKRKRRRLCIKLLDWKYKRLRVVVVDSIKYVIYGLVKNVNIW